MGLLKDIRRKTGYRQYEVMASHWVETLRTARKTALLQDGRRKVHYTFSDGKELVEEYDEKTDDLVVRKWRRKTQLGGQTPWEIEIGTEHSPPSNMTAMDISESLSNPALCRKDTSRAFQWRIRNLPYPLETYDLRVEDDHIVVRTTNKKYFKRIEIPDMKREGLKLAQADLTYAHANNTLIIQYKKPMKILNIHETIVHELKQLKISKEGDADCRPS